MPSAPYYDPHLVGLSDWLDQESVESHAVIESGRSQDSRPERFIPEGRVQEHLNDPRENFYRLTSIIKAVFSGDNHGTRSRQISAKNIADKCCKVFCILVVIGKAEYIEWFLTSDSLWDNCLPFLSPTPPEHFPHDPQDDDFYKKFCQAQWRFVALRVTSHNGLRIHKDRILPFVRREHITRGRGGAGTVSKVEIQKEHDGISPTTKQNQLYALKTFRSADAERNANRESTAFKNVTAAGTRSAPGIIEFYGSFEYRQTYNIILEFADGGTLDQLFLRRPPSSGGEIIGFWSSLFETIKGLYWIHNQHLPADDNSPDLILQGWHQDLKPENILLVSDPERPAYPWAFKVGDLGLCHFKTIMNGGPEAMAFNTFGTQTYGAPECYHMTEFSQLHSNLVKRNVDVWSLGCMFIEAYVWIIKGWEGLSDFRVTRKRATDAIPGFRGGNCFHNGQRILPFIDTYLENLASEKDLNDFATGLVLDTMIHEMLEEVPTKRPSAEQLESKADKLIRTARLRLDRAPIRTPLTPNHINDVVPQTPTHPTKQAAQTPNSNESSPSAASPQIWGIGNMYSTPQASGINHLPSPTTRNTMPTSQATDDNSTATQQAHKSLPLLMASALPHPMSPTPGPPNDPFTDAPALYDDAGSPAQPVTSKNSSHQPVSPHSMDDAQPVIGSSLQQILSPIPFCSVADAKVWYDKKEYGLPAELPDGDCLSELENRDLIFIVDDSASMAKHWQEVSNLVKILAKIAKPWDNDHRFDLYFLSSKKQYTFSNINHLYQKIRQHAPGGVRTLEHCFDTLLRKYAKDIERGRHEKPRFYIPIVGKKVLQEQSIIVFTDGILASGEETQGQSAIKFLIEKLSNASLTRNQFAIQFVSFGHDPDGLRRLRVLDELNEHLSLEMDIVDTEPSTGNILKMLLGGKNPKFDQTGEDGNLAIKPSSSQNQA